MSDLELELKDLYSFTKIYNLTDYLSMPSASLTRDLFSLKKDQFLENEKIIFSCFDDTPNDKVIELLVHLQKAMTFIDIPNFFVLIVTNRPALENNLEQIRKLHSIEDIPISYKFIDTPIIPTTNQSNYVALISPSETMCAQPWISLDVAGNGTFHPCCVYDESVTDANGTAYHAATHSIETVYNSEYMRQLRQDFREGKKPGPCRRCWSEEKDNTVSKRQLLKHRFPKYSYYTNYEQDDIKNLVFVSVAFGTACNFKCRICSPGASSSIAEEILSHSGSADKKAHPIYKVLTSGNWIKQHDAEIWKSLNDPNSDILYFDFAGGEPLLSTRHYTVLDNIISANRADKVSLRYNTNGSIFPKKYTDLWSNFKYVSIDISIDNIGPRFEFERAGGKWDQLLSNLDEFYKIKTNKIEISLHLVVSILNVYYLPEICEWIHSQSFSNIHFSTLYTPSYLNISHVTNEAKRIILDKLTPSVIIDPSLNRFVQSAINIIQQSTEISDGKEFREYMKRLDNYRNENFAQLYPEVAIAMGY